ncbi:hypothetical protein AB0B28_18560 [Glycomyces sp. NPDC046736]|uniref:hypothetical protein n=1 Tax=Glycomyces sp. NPDC046736 TaxID=3155615 RepID=UPI0033E534BC
MVEMILAGLIIGAVATLAIISAVRDRGRRKETRRAETAGPGRSEPIPSGWTEIERKPPTQRNGNETNAEPCAGGRSGPA